MSAADETIDSLKLPVFASIAEAYWNVFSRPRRLIVLSLAPAAANLMIAALFYVAVRSDDTINGLALSYLLLLLFPLSYLGLTWARQSSRQTHPKVLSVRPWGGTYAQSLGCHLLWLPFLYLALFSSLDSAVLLAQVVLVPNDGTILSVWIGPRHAFMILTFLLASLLPAALARLFLVMPMAAAGYPASLRAAWTLGRGFAFRLGSAIFALSLSHLVLATVWLFVVIAGLTATLYSNAFDIALVDMIYVHFRAAILATSIAVLPLGTVIAEALFSELMVIAFRHISSWTGVRQDIAERFD